MASNKSTVHIPFKRIDRSGNGVNAEPGTLEDAQNVYQDPAGEWRSRRGMVRVDETLVTGADGGTTYGYGTAVRDIATLRDGYVLRTDISTVSATTTKDAAADAYWHRERLSPRVSLRSDVIQAGPVLEGPRDNSTNNYANVVDSVVVGGRLWITYSTENASAAGNIILRCYDAASTVDQVTGPMLYEIESSNAAILGSDGSECFCPKLAQYNDISLVWTFIHHDAVNGDTLYVYRIADARATVQVSAPTLRAALDTGVFVFSLDREGDPIMVAGRALYDIRRVGTASPNDDVLIAYNKRTAAPLTCYLNVYSVVANASTVVTGNIVANCAVQWLAQPPFITGRMSLALIGDGYTVSASVPTPLNGIWRVVIDPATRDVKAGITGALIQINADVPEHLACWTTVDGAVSMDNFAYSTPGAGYSYTAGDPIVLWFYRQTYNSAAAASSVTSRNDGIIPVSRAFLTNYGAADGGRWAFWAVYTGQNLDPSLTAPTANDWQQCYVLVSASYCNTVTDVAFEVCGKVHHDQALVPYVGTKNASLRMGDTGYGTYSSMHMTSPVVHRASTATRNGSFGTILWRETSVDRSVPARPVLCDVRSDFGAEDMGKPVTINGVCYFPGGVVDNYDTVDCAEAGFVFRPETPIVATAAGTSTAGTHTVCVVFSFRDSRGNLYRSAPSPGVAVTTTAAQGFTVSIQAPNMSARVSGFSGSGYGNFEIEVYATTAGGTIYYRIPIASGSYPYFYSHRPNYLSYTVSPGTDAVLATGEVLYTEGGVLDNDCPPCAAVLAAWNNRLWMAGCEDRATIRYSKEFEELRGVEFSDAFVTRALGDDQDFTAIAPFGDRLFLFKRDKIFALAGDGPDNTGSGTYGPPELVASGVGTIRPASVLVTNDGVYFASMTSIMLLDGAGRVTDVGAPLRGLITDLGVHSTSGGLSIVGAAHIPASNLIAFHYSGTVGGVATNGLFVWDMPNKTWYRWTWDSGNKIAGPVAATTDGLLVQTNTSSALELMLYDHNSSTYDGPYDTISSGSDGVTASLITNWISLPSVGSYERMYEAILQYRHYAVTPAITCQMTTDLDGSKSTEVFTASPAYASNADEQVQFRTKYPKGSRYKFWLYNVPSGTTTVPQVGYRGITMVVALSGRTARLRVARKASS